MKKKIFSLILLVFGINATAQQEALFTHYSFNTLGINPAYAGSRDALTVTALHRSQWVGFEGAPQTQTITLHAPVFSEKIGLGLSLLNDAIGSSSNQGVFIDLAYRLKLGDGYLSFALKGGVNLYSNRLSELWIQDQTDNQFLSNTQNLLAPNFGAGIYYKARNFFLGFSSPALLNNNLSNDINISAKKERHFYTIAGAHLNLNSKKTVSLRPTAYLKFVNGAIPQVDLTALFYFKNKFWVGPMTRTKDALGLLTGLNLNKQFALGYSFDWSYANKTASYNSGSHEIMLRYDFIFENDGRIKSPRYF